MWMAVAVGALVLTGVALPRGRAAGAASAQSIGVPAYFYPAGTGLRYWDQLRSGGSRVSVVIATGLGLDGTSPDANYQLQVSKTRAAGIRVLAYVTTTSGDKPLAKARLEIDRAFGWYKVDGIFFDEAVRYPVACDQVDYYRSLNAYTKARKPNATTVINHGQILPECYADVADIMMNAEMSAASYTSTWKPWGWEQNYPPEKFWHLVHSTATVPEMQEIIRLSRSRNAGRVFVSSATLSSPGGPYGSLPAADYWGAELSAVSAVNSPTTSPVGSPTTTSTTATPASTTTVPWTAPAAPAVSSFSPSSGPPGSTVRILGESLGAVNMVTLDGGPVQIVGRTDTALTVVLNSWNTSGQFWVSAPGGASALSTGSFTVIR